MAANECTLCTFGALPLWRVNAALEHGCALAQEFYKVANPGLYGIEPADAQAEVLREFAALRYFTERRREDPRFECVVELVGAVVDGAGLVKMLVMERAECSLDGFMSTVDESEGMDVVLLLRCMRRALQALAVLHSGDAAGEYVHRDVKPANLLMFRGARGALDLKLGDLGYARIVAPGMTAPIGTPLFAAPEVLDKRQYGTRADVYSWAMSFCFVAVAVVTLGGHCNVTPVAHVFRMDAAEVKAEALRRFALLDERVCDVVKDCLKREPGERPTAAAALERLSGAIRDGANRSLGGRVRVCVLGCMNSGKSTFINALLQRNVLPARSEAETALVVSIEDSADADDADGQLFVHDHTDVSGRGLRLARGCSDIQARIRDLNRSHRDQIRAGADMYADGTATAALPFTADGVAFSGHVPHLLLRIPFPDSLTGGEDGRGRFLLYDTPGPNDATAVALRDITSRVLQNSDVVIVVETFGTAMTTDQLRSLRYVVGAVFELW